MNTTLLEKAGLDPAGPKNWEELAQYCKTIKEETGAYGLSMYSYIWVLEAFLLGNGTSVLNPEETKTNIADEKSIEAIQFFKDLKDQGYIRCVAGADSTKIDAEDVYKRQGVHNHLAVSVSGRPADGLDQRRLRPEETLLIRIQNGDQGNLRDVQALPQKVDAHQDVKFPKAQVADDLHPLDGVPVSYTHLDVYKRQGSMSARGTLLANSMKSASV